MGLKEALEGVAGEMVLEALAWHNASELDPHHAATVLEGFVKTLKLLAIAADVPAVPVRQAVQPLATVDVSTGLITMPKVDLSPEAAKQQHRAMIDKARAELRAERERQEAEALREGFQAGWMPVPVVGGLCDGQTHPLPNDTPEGAGITVQGQPYVYRRGRLCSE